MKLLFGLRHRSAATIIERDDRQNLVAVLDDGQPSPVGRPGDRAEPVEHVDEIDRLGVLGLSEDALRSASGAGGNEHSAAADVEQLLAVGRPTRLGLVCAAAIDRHGRSAIDRFDQYLPAGNRACRIRHGFAIR